MNLFLLLFVPLEEAPQIVSKQHDKTRVYFAYIPKMNLNIQNRKLSKSEINFLEIRRSLQTNPNLSIYIPPNTIQDLEPFDSSRKIDIIGETPPRYVTMDPSNYDNVSNQSESFDGEEIPKLDKIPCYARSIQQVLSNKEKLDFSLTNNTPLVIEILTNYDLIKKQYIARFEDSLFSYEHKEPFQEMMPK